MLIVLPLGLLGAVPIVDVIQLVTKEAVWGHMAFWMIVLGGIGGLLAAIPGFIDWLEIPKGTRAKRVGLTHAVTVVLGLAVFAVSLLLRYQRGTASLETAAFVLGLIGLIILSVGGWLGGELVQRMGVGVHPKASLDASSSLADRGERHWPSPAPVPPGRTPTEPRPA